MPPTAKIPRPALKILVVEDRPLDAELMIAELNRAGFSGTSSVRVETAADFLTELGNSPDVILCDYALPGFGALEALQLLQERKLDIPFIVVSGSIGEETAVDAIKNGADDYLLKDRLGRLGSAVMQAVEEKKLRAAANRAEEDLRQSEFKYRCLFEHLPEAAYLCDSTTGKIIDTNQRGERILGLERAQILGTRLSGFVPESIFHALLATAENTAGLASEWDCEIVGASGNRVPVRISTTVVPIYNRRLLLTFFREMDETGKRAEPKVEATE